MESPVTPLLLIPMVSSRAMEAALSADKTLAAMARFEAALALAEASMGIVPAEAARVIADVAETVALDAAAIAQAGPDGANIAIPFVKALTRAVAVRDEEAAKWVHFGATSQDVIDTANVLLAGEALALISDDLERAMAAAARLAKTHHNTVMAGRTLLQQALPTTFGLKAAGLLDALMRHDERLVQAWEDLAVLQFGGAAGTLASLGDKGWEVGQEMADILVLSACPPWHGYRDRVIACGGALAGLTATCGKWARDVALMMQTEIGEVMEPAAPGRGGSSTLPHKRNPVLSTLILAGANLAPQAMASLCSAGLVEHERAAGGWQAEWFALADLLRLTGGAISRLAEMLEGLEVRTERMLANLDATHGLIMTEAVQMALAPTLGRGVAHDLIEAIARKVASEGADPRRELLAEPRIAAVLDSAHIDALLDPSSYLGSTKAMVDDILSRYHEDEGE